MVGDTIDDMGVPEVPQPLTGKLRTLETPGYVFFCCTSTKPMPALLAVRRYPFGETSVAANPFDGDPLFPGELLQLLGIVYSRCKIVRTRSAVNAADCGQVFYLLFHDNGSLI